jgi:hypothetical protein
MKIEKMDQWTDSNQIRVGTAEPGRNSFGSVNNSNGNNFNINEKSQLNTLTQSRNKEELLTKPTGLLKSIGVNETSTTTLHQIAPVGSI